MVQKLLAIDPNYTEALNGKGLALDSLGKYEEAITWYDKALGIDPNYMYSLYNKGLALSTLKKYQEAIKWYDKAWQLSLDTCRPLMPKRSRLSLGRLSRGHKVVR